MQIEFFGHAAIGLTTTLGEKILFDPYREGGLGGKLNYTTIRGKWDWVIITHKHDDHSAKDTLEKGFKSGKKVLAEHLKLERFSIAHDEYEGTKFGGKVDIIKIVVDGFTCVHLSDVGCAPALSILKKLGEVDICFLPIGGFYTIGPLQAKAWWAALSPKITIPIHYKTPSVNLELETLDSFLSLFPSSIIASSDVLTFQSPKDLQGLRQIQDLTPQNLK